METAARLREVRRHDPPQGGQRHEWNIVADRAAIVHAYKVRHYETWPDTPLPALGLRTPRQACKTKAGRQEVDLLLRDMESHEARQPEAEMYDFAGVRRELGFG